MKSRSILAILFCCAVVVPLAYNTAATSAENDGSPSAVAAWEHLALQHDGAGLGGDLSRQITRLGSEGWELVCVTPIALEGTTEKTIYYFKRAK